MEKQPLEDVINIGLSLWRSAKVHQGKPVKEHELSSESKAEDSDLRNHFSGLSDKSKQRFQG